MEQKNESIKEISDSQQAIKKKGSFFSDIADMLEAIIISVFIVIMLFAYVIRPVTVEGQSMESTLQNQDKLFMTDLLYTPERGDIVIVDNSTAWLYDESDNLVKKPGLSEDKRLIKRVIAKGGDTVNIDFSTGEVTLNGVVIEEPYINNLTINDEGAFDYPITVPEGYLFVMGDNRQHSSDSRHPNVGFVSEEQILGKAIFRFSPFSSFGGIYE